MPVIVDREQEQRELLELARRPGRDLALVYGRRRVGKTWLLTHLWGESEAFYFTAAAVTPEQNRRRLVREASEWTGQEHRLEDHPTWRTVFRLLLSMKPTQPLVIVLDEFQYLGGHRHGLDEVTSELNAAWERRTRSDRSVLLVLSGSSVRLLEALDAGGAPLHGRLTWKARLEPFDYRDTASMVPFDDLRDRASAYGIFGGMPRYLAPVDAERSLGANVARLALSPRGEVRGQVETAILQEQGLRDIPKYLGIMRAIGSGRTELSEIADRAGLSKDTTVREKVERLVGLGYVDRQRNFDAGRTSPWRYVLADPAFRFYHRFVARYDTTIDRSPPEEVWTAHVEPQLDAYMGHLFEDIAAQAYQRLRGVLDLPMVARWARWEGTDRSGASLEMDIVARLATGAMLTGSIKWNRSPVGPEVHRAHLRDLDRLAHAGRRWAHEARERGSWLLYVAAGGFTEGFAERAGEQRLPVITWSLEDLYGA